MARASFDSSGADEMARALRKAGKDGRKAVRAAGKEVGEIVSTKAQAKARGGNAMQRAAAKRILAGATMKGGTIRIANTARVPFAVAAFMGVQGRRGWYAARKYQGKGKQQFPGWVGNQYAAGGTGGPYHVNPAIRQSLPRVEQVFEERIAESFRTLGLTLE